jgi:molybdenum cofactor guanylyltransferase
VVADKHVVVEKGWIAERGAIGSPGDAGTDTKPRHGAAMRAACEAGSHLSGVVLCGGKSSRMGRDKAELAVGSRSLLEHAAALLAQLTPDVRLACGSQARYAELKLPLVLDRVADAGPLAGLESALASARPGLVIAIACDMPRLEASVLQALVDRAHSGDLDVAMLCSERGLEPLCAVWSTRMSGAVRAALDARQFKMTSVFDAVLADGSKPRVGTIAVSALLSGRLPTTESAASALVLNVNTPEDYARELELHADLAAHSPRGAKARR